jgi:hypothetical protein
VLRGGDDGVGALLARLRTEFVDVDARGKKCKERRARVLRRSEAAATDVVPAQWTETTYARADADAVAAACVAGEPPIR